MDVSKRARAQTQTVAFDEAMPATEYGGEKVEAEDREQDMGGFFSDSDEDISRTKRKLKALRRKSWLNW